ASFEVAMLADCLPECVDVSRRKLRGEADVSPRKVGGVAEVEPTDHRQQPLLRPRRQRPSHCTKSCNEIAPLHRDVLRRISGTYLARDRIGNGYPRGEVFYCAARVRTWPISVDLRGAQSRQLCRHWRRAGRTGATDGVTGRVQPSW